MVPVAQNAQRHGAKPRDQVAGALGDGDCVLDPTRMIVRQQRGFEFGFRDDRNYRLRSAGADVQRSNRYVFVGLDSPQHVLTPSDQGAGHSRLSRASAPRCSCEARCGDMAIALPTDRSENALK